MRRNHEVAVLKTDTKRLISGGTTGYQLQNDYKTVTNRWKCRASYAKRLKSGGTTEFQLQSGHKELNREVGVARPLQPGFEMAVTETTPLHGQSPNGANVLLLMLRPQHRCLGRHNLLLL